MLNQVLFYSGSAFIAFWGVAHLFPTRSVVSGFGEISADNKRIMPCDFHYISCVDTSGRSSLAVLGNKLIFQK
jgi:hypothetical protein